MLSTVKTTLAAALAAASTLAMSAAAMAQEAATKAADHAHDAAGHAADAAHETVGPIPTISQGIVSAVAAIVAFILVLAVFRVAVWPKIMKGLDDREGKILGEIKAAEAARSQAKTALEQYERNLADARNEANKMLETAKVQQIAQTAALKAQADIELAAMKDKAIREIDSAKKAAIGEIHSHAAELASAAASKILRREINRNDQQRMVDECLAELKV